MKEVFTIFTPERRTINRFKREDKRLNHADHIEGCLKWLTDRDISILRLLLDHKIMKTSQIEMIIFSDLKPSSWRNKSGERLRRLYKTHLVDRFYPPVDSGAGSSEAHYILDTVGAKVLAQKLGFNMENIKFKKLTYVGQNYGHTLKIIDFKAMLHLLNKQLGTGEIIRFQIEHAARIKYRTHDGKKGELIPDAFCIYKYTSDRVKLFYLEIDNATESIEVLQSKIRRYVECYKSNAWRETDWGIIGAFPAVIIVLHNEERALIKYARSLKSNVRFLFTTYDQFFSTEEKTYVNAQGKTRKVLQKINVNLFEPIYKPSRVDEDTASL